MADVASQGAAERQASETVLTGCADHGIVAPPEALGLDSAPLRALGEWLGSFTQANVHGVLVVRHGTLVYERYFAGEDEIWGEPVGRVSFDFNTKHDLRSITKSVISLLVGIAIERKLIASIDEPAFGFFPEYSDLRTPEKERILLRHLLAMSAGLEWDEYLPYSDPENSWIRMLGSPDRFRYVLERPVQAPPGALWTYSSGISELLGAVIRKAARRPLEDFAQEFLFDPLGINDVAWSKYPNSDFVSADSGLRLRPRDAAKLGQLVLNRGTCEGARIVSAEWIDDSIAAQIGPADMTLFYGYQWWLGRSLVKKREVLWVAGMGYGGQRLFIVPEFDLVVVVTAGDYGGPTEVWVASVILNRYVLAAINT